MKTIEERAWDVLNDRMSCNCTDGTNKFVLINMDGYPYAYNDDWGLNPIREIAENEDYVFWSIDK